MENPKEKNGGLRFCSCPLALALARLPPFSISLFLPPSLSFSTLLFLCAIRLTKKKNEQTGAHAFPKRRVLLQDNSSTSSSGGNNGGTAGSSTSFSNIVSGAEDSPDRVEASPAVALAESPLSDAELCAVSKQVKKEEESEKKTKIKKKKHVSMVGFFFSFFFSFLTLFTPSNLFKTQLPTNKNTHKQIYGSVPPECANQPQIAVRTLPVKVGPVGEPLSLGVDEAGAITASGGNPPDVDAADWDPVAGRPLSQSSSSKSKKLSSGAVAGIVVGAVAAFVALVAAVAVSRKRRAARSVAGLAAARAGTSSSR